MKPPLSGSVRFPADMHFPARWREITATGGCLRVFMKNSCTNAIGKGWTEKRWRRLLLILHMWQMSIATMSLSMPLTPSKEEMYSVLVVDKDRVYEMPMSEIPLVESISGFFDMLRVYTTAENREKVERAIKKVLGDQGILNMGASKIHAG